MQVREEGGDWTSDRLEDIMSHITQSQSPDRRRVYVLGSGGGVVPFG